MIKLLMTLCLLTPGLRADDSQDALDFFQAQDEVVTSTKARLDRKNAPATTLTVTADDISRFGYRTVGEALRSLPGMFTTNDRLYSYLGVRGLSPLGDYGSRVLVLIDGNSVGDAIYSSASIGNELGVDIDQIKRIEVVLGPGSTEYGSHAMFMVVNVITKDGADLRGARLGAGYGSFDSKEGKFSAGASSPGALSWFAGGALLNSFGQDIESSETDVTGGINNGVFHDADHEQAYQGIAKLSYGSWTLEGGANWRKKFSPNASSATVLWSTWDDNRSFDVDQWNFAELRYAGKPGGLELGGRLYMRNYQWEGSYTQADPNTLGLFNNDSIATNQRLGAELDTTFELFRHDHLTLGAEYVNDYVVAQTSKNRGYGDPSLDADLMDDRRSQVDAAGYAEDVYQPNDAFTLLVGLRYDYYATFDASLSPRAALLFHFLQGSSLKLLYGRAFSQPIAYTQFNHDSGLSVLSNPGLKAESVQTYEAVFEQQLNRDSTLRLSAYRNAFDNLIGQVATSIPSSLYPDVLWQWQNGGATLSQGAELSIASEWQGWKGRIGGNLQQSWSDTGFEIANSPRASAGAALSMPLGLPGSYLSVESAYLGSRISGSGTLVEPYCVTNFTLFSSSLIPHVELTLKLNNAFDSVYIDPSGIGGLDLITQDRRNAFAKATYVY